MELIDFVAHLSSQSAQSDLGIFLLAGGVLWWSARSGPQRSHWLPAVVAGAVCGGLWVLIAAIILSVASPGMMTAPLALGIWGTTGLAVAVFVLRPGTPREAWGRAAMAVGLHGLALPISAAISFVVTAVGWSPVEATDLELSLDILGVRLARTPTIVRLGVSGFVLGLVLISVGDRALRQPGRGSAARMLRGARRYFR
jgi:hypothetical protein